MMKQDMHAVQCTWNQNGKKQTRTQHSADCTMLESLSEMSSQYMVHAWQCLGKALVQRIASTGSAMTDDLYNNASHAST
jgi:hypothetical protein